MKKSIAIPLSLLERIVELLDGLDVSRYGYNFCCEYEDIHRELESLMRRFESSRSYARIISTDFCEESRCIFRIQHLLRFKNWDSLDFGEPF